MRITATMLILMMLALAAGCSGGSKANELLDTARFEEKQNNRDHARKLYEEIVAKYPDSPAAAEAKYRLGQIK